MEKRNYKLNCKVRSKEEKSGEYIPAENSGLLCEYKVMDSFGLGELVEIKLENCSENDFCGVIHFELSVAAEKPAFFMPGYMYGNNTADMPNHGRKEFPRLAINSSVRAESDFWMTRSDRLAEPVSLIYDTGRVVGIAASPYWIGSDSEKSPWQIGKENNTPFYRFSGFSCSIGNDGTAGVGYTLGYENAPLLFIQTANVVERKPLAAANCFSVMKGEVVSFVVRIYDYCAEDATGIHEAIKDVYSLYHQSPRSIPGMDIKKATNYLACAIKDYAWLEQDGMYSGFVYDRERIEYNKIGSLSWTNGLAVAVPMICAANRMGDPEMRRQSLTFIENVIKNSYNEKSHLLYEAVQDGVWSVKGWWYSGMHSGGHSSYLNGQAVYYILKAYVSEKNIKRIVHDDWIEFVKPVIDTFEKTKNTDREYPFSMSEETGAGLEYDSLGGAWCLAATALYIQITGDETYLKGIIESELHYYDKFVRKVVCYGGPLDTDKAVDNEGILAYVRAVKSLHELTGNQMYIEHLKQGLYYEASFKLGYNTPVQVKPLKEIGWSSCGGSITSVANPHIHPMSSTVIDEMNYYVKLTDDEYMRSRLNDTAAWGMQTFNTYDKEYGYGYVGWMSERFCFCEGLVVEKYPDGAPAGTWFALMPWAGASIIEGFTGDYWDV